ncbi:MAG: class I SAM-dependent methyltransferase [Calditrichaeota bacterium]|nr:class I SAM-dependent methyltransferase [Calditrichota bacterium]
MWNERFNTDQYIYGKEPNHFLAESAKYLSPSSKILSIGEGEGRNAVYLASLGHYVTAVDSSVVGLRKALALADEKNVKIKIVETNLADYNFETEKWDAVISIFCHLPSVLRNKVHAGIIKALKSEGLLIMESYSKDQLKYKSGGPKDLDMLLDLETTKQELNGLHFLHLKTTVRDISEGAFHTGDGSVVQVIGRKP